MGLTDCFIHTFISELVYCGMILENDCTLTSYGIKPGVTIHVLEKKIESPPVQTPSLSWAEIQQLVTAFRAFMLSPGCRAALQVKYKTSAVNNKRDINANAVLY